MSILKFEWDENKASANLKKHGISFDEAKTVFFDERAKLIDDPDHSDSEDRFILLGLSSSLRIMVVCHCYRMQTMSYASSQLARRPLAKPSFTPEVQHEKRI